MLNKKAQVSDTMTWVVATLIIIFILGIFIYASSILAKAKSIEKNAEGFFSEDFEQTLFWVDVKTSFAFELNSDNKEKIQRWLEDE